MEDKDILDNWEDADNDVSNYIINSIYVFMSVLGFRKEDD